MEIITIILLFICAIALIVLSIYFIKHGRQIQDYIEELNGRVEFYVTEVSNLSNKIHEIEKGKKDEKRDNTRKNKSGNRCVK